MSIKPLRIALTPALTAGLASVLLFWSAPPASALGKSPPPEAAPPTPSAPAAPASSRLAAGAPAAQAAPGAIAVQDTRLPRRPQDRSRASGDGSATVHTWRGAEVIVPNATLISGNLSNRTLSDRTLRFSSQEET